MRANGLILALFTGLLQAGRLRSVDPLGRSGRGSPSPSIYLGFRLRSTLG